LTDLCLIIAIDPLHCQKQLWTYAILGIWTYFWKLVLAECQTALIRMRRRVTRRPFRILAVCILHCGSWKALYGLKPHPLLYMMLLLTHSKRKYMMQRYIFKKKRTHQFGMTLNTLWKTGLVFNRSKCSIFHTINHKCLLMMKQKTCMWSNGVE